MDHALRSFHLMSSGKSSWYKVGILAKIVWRKTLSLAFFLPITALASLRRDRERDDLGTSQICELNLLLLLSLAPRGFYSGTPVFPFSTKTLLKFNLIWNSRTRLYELPGKKVPNCVGHVSFILLTGHCYIDTCYTKLNSISWI